MATNTPHATLIQHGADTLVVATVTRAQAERDLREAGFSITYPVLTREGNHNYDGPGADIALANLRTVYRLDAGTMTPLVRRTDELAMLRSIAAGALAALDSGDVDAVRTALVKASAGAAAPVQIDTQDEQEPAEPVSEISDLEVAVYETIQKLESASAEEISAQVEGDVESAITSLQARGMVAEDGHTAQGAVSYCDADAAADAA